MAGEITFDYGVSGSTLYALATNSAGQIYNGSTLEAPLTANWATYDIALAEQGTTGIYIGTFPVVAAGVYGISVRLQAGGAPATTDDVIGSGVMNWDGTAEILPTSRAEYTAARATKLDNLDAAISTRTKPADTQARVTLVDTTTALTNAPSDSSGITTLLSRLSAARAGYLDNLSAGAVALEATLATVATYIDTEITTITNRIGAFTGTGVNTILGFLKAIASKAATLPSDIGDTFAVATDSLESLREKLDGGTVTTNNSVASSGHVTIVRGDDYATADSRNLTWSTTSASTWPDLTNATITFTARHIRDRSKILSTAGSVVTPTGATKSVSVALTASQTTALSVGVNIYEFEVKAVLQTSSNIVRLVRDQMTVQEGLA